MRIIDIRTFHGPNVFADFPVLRMTLELGDYQEKHSALLPGFTDRLLALLPGLFEHRCSRGRAGGFVERLREGTYLGHIVEHVALELSTPSGIEVTYGKTVYAGSPGLYHVAVEFENEAAMRHLLEAAVELVCAVIDDRSYDLTPVIAEAKRLTARTALGPSTRALAQAATDRGIPWERLNEGSLLVLGYGKHRRFLQAATSSRTSFVAVDIAGDKQLTKELLARAGIPVPRGRITQTADDAVRALQELSGPVVVKPLDGNHGKGVSLNLTTADEVRHAFEFACEYSSDVLIEEMVQGTNYRVLVVGGKMVAASERTPAHVVGDGVHTVKELIEIENQNPLRAPGHGSVLTQIEIDCVALAFLEKGGRTLDHVPAVGEFFAIRESANLSTGGIARDVTEALHPDTVLACERAAGAIDLDICGIDLVCNDITQPLAGQGAIIELNAAPGLRMHEHPSHGKARPVAAHIIDWLFPPGTPSRIPLISITGTNGKTTCSRLTAHIMAQTGQTVGLTTTEGIYIGGKCVEQGDTTGPGSARIVLSDPTVDVAVLETARGGIVRRGLGYDWSDVGVITNIQCDHLGQDGIETIDDLLHVKSVVAERVRKGGTVVLNADDALLRELPGQRRMAKLERKYVYFSLDAQSEFIARHVAEGGVAYVEDDEQIIELESSARRVIANVNDIPLTLGGGARFQVANVLAVVAACRAQGVPAHLIASGLSSFDANLQNPGRMNLLRVGAGYAVLDYGHNPGSYTACSALACTWKGRRLTAVVSVPGDRDASVHELAAKAIARCFSRVIVKEDVDRRGRAPGEVANYLASTIRDERPTLECEVILDEEHAVRHALDTMEPDEVVMIFTDAAESLQRMLLERGAVPTQTIPRVAAPLSGLRLVPSENFEIEEEEEAYAKVRHG
nr:Cyanophycin synthetase [uncultured bacterium]